MSWESRNGRGNYYTRSRRRFGRVIREYFGTDEVAVLIAKLDAIERRQRAAAKQECQHVQRHFAELDRLVARACDGIEIVARAALVAAGYRQHQRGEWRERRES